MAKGDATTAEPPGISSESSGSPTRTRVRAKDSRTNAITAEKMAIQPATAARAKEMQTKRGAREHTKEPEARDDTKEKAKAPGRLTEETYSDWNQPKEEKPGSVGSFAKEDSRKVIYQDGYELIKNPRTGFAVDRFTAGA